MSASSINAAEVTVACAANFAAAMKEIAAAFESASSHKVRVAIGATGAFHAQVRSGAPFDVLLAADDATAALLENEGHAIRGSRFTYAVGRLVLWSATAGLVDDKGEVLSRGDLRNVAIANPRLAPYGQAAVETMRRMGVYEKLAPRLVQGENVGQAFQFAATGNAQVGFVALAQALNAGGSMWRVPADLHSPLRQDAVILKHGEGNAAAGELVAFIKGEKARGIIRAYGYGLP